MTETIQATRTSVPAPWFLTEEDLAVLSDSLDQLWEELETERKAELEHRLEEEMERLRSENPDEDQESLKARRSSWHVRELVTSDRSCTLWLHGDQRIEAESLKKATRKRETLESLTLGFEIVLNSGNRRVEVVTRRRWGNTIDIEAKPDSDRVSQAAFSTLLHWRDRIAPSNIIALWKKYSWVAFLMALLPYLVFVWTLFPANENGDSLAWRQKAFQLLEGGLDEDEIPEATETVLAMLSGYPASEPVIGQGPSAGILRVRMLSVALVIVLLALCVAPRSVIGLGPGKTRLVLWRWWSKFLWYAVPVFLFGSLVLEPLGSWMRQAFVP